MPEADVVNDTSLLYVAFLLCAADAGQRSSSTDSRVKQRRSDADTVTSRGTTSGCDVIVTPARDLASMSSSPTSSSMPHLGPSDKRDTIHQAPLSHIYRSSSAALTGLHDDEEAVAIASVAMSSTNKRWAGGRQGRYQGSMTSRDHSVEQCYWSCLSTRSSCSRCAMPSRQRFY